MELYDGRVIMAGRGGSALVAVRSVLIIAWYRTSNRSMSSSLRLSGLRPRHKLTLTTRDASITLDWWYSMSTVCWLTDVHIFNEANHFFRC